jgi:hypothetical protein
MIAILRSLALFVAAGVCEIGGGGVIRGEIMKILGG